MTDSDPMLIPPPSIGTSPESVGTIGKVPRKGGGGSKLWLLVLACVVVGVSLGVLVYQQSVSPKTATRPKASPTPLASPTAPQISAVSPSANTLAFTQAGKVRIYYLAITQASIRLYTEITTPSSSTTVEMPWTSASQPFAVADTGIDVSAGQQLSYSISFDAAGQQKLVGWAPPVGGKCGANGFDTADVTAYVSAATAAAGGKPIVAVQCWGDSTPGEMDFNDILLIWSYTPETASPSLSPSPSASAIASAVPSATPKASKAPSPSPTPSPSPSKTPSPTPTPTPMASHTPTPTPTPTSTPVASHTVAASPTPTPSARVAMPEASALPDAGVFEVTATTASVGIVLLILGLLGLLLF